MGSTYNISFYRLYEYFLFFISTGNAFRDYSRINYSEPFIPCFRTTWEYQVIPSRSPPDPSNGVGLFLFLCCHQRSRCLFIHFTACHSIVCGIRR